MLPRGFHNKRRYGFWSYRVRTENLALIRCQMGVAPVVLDMLWEDMAAALDVWPSRRRPFESASPFNRYARAAVCRACMWHRGTVRGSVTASLRSRQRRRRARCRTASWGVSASKDTLLRHAGAGRCRWQAGARYANATVQRASRQSILKKSPAPTLRHASVLFQYMMSGIQPRFFRILLWDCG